jgi:hypothetical protein
MSNTSYTLSSNAQYRDVTQVSFNPVSKVKLRLVDKAGKLTFWKWLGLIPVIPYKPKKDKYRSDWYDGKKTLESWKNYLGSYDHFIKGDTLYEKARVIVRGINRTISNKTFESNDAANRYVEEVKEKCKLAGNSLV